MRHHETAKSAFPSRLQSDHSDDQHNPRGKSPDPDQKVVAYESTALPLVDESAKMNASSSSSLRVR